MNNRTQNYKITSPSITIWFPKIIWEWIYKIKYKISCFPLFIFYCFPLQKKLHDFSKGLEIFHHYPKHFQAWKTHFQIKWLFQEFHERRNPPSFFPIPAVLFLCLSDGLCCLLIRYTKLVCPVFWVRDNLLRKCSFLSYTLKSMSKYPLCCCFGVKFPLSSHCTPHCTD